MENQNAGTPGQPPTPPQPVVPQQAPAGSDDTKGLGTIALICSIAGIFVRSVDIIGLVLGIIGLNKAKKYQQETGMQASGRGLSLAAVIISSISIGLGFILLVIILIAYGALFFAQ